MGHASDQGKQHLLAPVNNADLPVSFVGGDAGSLRTASTLHTAFNIICSVVGVGILQLPAGVAASGWVGIGALVFLAICATYTGLRIVDCIRRGGPAMRTYGDLGEEAFGPWGRWFVDVQVHVTLVGVAIVYLVLIGENLHSLFPHSIAPRVGVVIAGCVVWGHVFLKTLREVGILSAFNVCVAVALFVVVVVESLTHGPGPEVVVETTVVRWSVSLGTSFAAFSFSYGVHPLLPSMYESMAKPQQYAPMLLATFGCVLLFYIPMSAIGYSVYGDTVKSVIYENLPRGPAVTAIIVAVTVHVICSYAIIISASEQAIERKFTVEERGSPLLWRVALRTAVTVFTTSVAVAMANVFGPFLDLVSSVTSSFTVFILPCLMYMRMFRGEISPVGYAWNGLVVLIAMLGGGFGTYSAIKEIIATF
jgi:amino acid permease